MGQCRKCSKCGCEEGINEPWMPFYDIGEGSFCGMCISLALLFLEEYEEVRTQGIRITTNPQYRCLECQLPASKKHPQFLIKEQPICITCMSLLLSFKRKEVREELKEIRKWQRERLN